MIRQEQVDPTRKKETERLISAVKPFLEITTTVVSISAVVYFAFLPLSGLDALAGASDFTFYRHAVTVIIAILCVMFGIAAIYSEMKSPRSYTALLILSGAWNLAVLFMIVAELLADSTLVEHAATWVFAGYSLIMALLGIYAAASFSRVVTIIKPDPAQRVYKNGLAIASQLNQAEWENLPLHPPNEDECEELGIDSETMRESVVSAFVGKD